MIGHILKHINSMPEYKSAISLYASTDPISKNDADVLINLYMKYEKHFDVEITSDIAKICIACDIMRIRGTSDDAQFAGLSLNSITINALKLALSIISDTQFEPDPNQVLELIGNESVLSDARVILARVALDRLVTSTAFEKIQYQIRVISQFLKSVTNDTTNRCSSLIVYLRRGGAI